MGLASRIAKASAAVGGRLKADSRNNEQKYDYISADKILSVCGQALAEQGVVVIPAIAAEVVDIVDRGNGKYRYDAAVTFHMIVADDEKEITAMWVGRGSDYTVPDKATYKAITSGHKYFLMKLLNIGEGNEDGEHDPAEEAPRPQPQRQTQQPPVHRQPVPTPPANGNGSDKAERLLAKLRQLQADSKKEASQPMYAFASGIINRLTDNNHTAFFESIADKPIANEDGQRIGYDLAKYIIEYASDSPSKDDKAKGLTTNPKYSVDVVEAIKAIHAMMTVAA